MNIHFILVNPAVPGNIGASARAMKTMGFKQMILLDPKCDHFEDEAKWLAHASHDILESALVVDSFEKIKSNYDFLIGTSAKSRIVKNEYYCIKDLPTIIHKKEGSIKNIAILFGSEESGLPNEILKQCDLVSYIPLKTKYPSLNLSQAVMLYAYALSEISEQKEERSVPSEEQSKYKIAKELTAQFLINLDMDRNPNLFNRIFERMAMLDSDDLNLVLSILNKNKNANP